MILNLMSESGVDGYRTASVLGYCLLPLVLLSCVGVAVPLRYANCEWRGWKVMVDIFQFIG